MATFTNKATLSYNGRTIDSNTVTGTFLETLAISKTATVDSYTGESILTYVVGLVNSGAATFTGLTLVDDLGGYDFGGTTLYPLEYVDGSLLYYVNGALQVSPVPTNVQPLTVGGISVPAGGNAVLVYSVRVGDAAPLDVDGQIVNTASVSGSGLAEPIEASETVFTADSPELTITKELSPTVVSENGTINYTFVIRNSGNTAAVATDDVVLTDLFDPVLAITSVTLDGAPLTQTTDYTYNTLTGEFATVAGVITVPAATYTQNPDGSYTVIPGETTLVVVGTV